MKKEIYTKTKTKVCSDCKKEKSIKDFSLRRGHKGRWYANAVCKKCAVIRNTKWRKENYEKYKKYQRKYQREYWRKYHKKKK